MAIYSDIDFSLTKTQYSDATILEDLDAVKQSLKNIIFTKKGSRIRYRNPEFGSNIHKLLFEKVNKITAIQIRNEIITVVNNFEPRVKIINVNVVGDPDEKMYSVIIEYTLVNLAIENELTLNLAVIK